MIGLALIGMVQGCAVQPPRAQAKTVSDSPYRDLDTVKVGEIIHLPTGIAVTEEQLFRVLSGSRIVYVGETHTNMEDHRVELEILKGLADRHPGKVALGMEMFQRSFQTDLDRWAAGGMDEKSFMKIWHANWDQDYGYYKAIFEFVRERNIPLIGLNASQTVVRAVMEKGLEGVGEEIKGELPDMDPSDPYQRSSLEAVFGGHGGTRHGFDRFYQTMMVWDETMAQTVAEYLSSPAGEGRIMVVFTGGFHVNYGFGVPRKVFRRIPAAYQIVLPYTVEIPAEHSDIFMKVEPVSLPLLLADFVWGVGYRELPEKRTALGVGIKPGDGGVEVTRVMPGSPASKAGIREGDVIIFFDGRPVREMVDLIHQVEMKAPGESAVLQILREGKHQEAKVLFGGNIEAR